MKDSVGGGACRNNGDRGSQTLFFWCINSNKNEIYYVELPILTTFRVLIVIKHEKTRFIRRKCCF